MCYYIYKLTCTENGKGYVGYTNNIQRRMREHKATALTGKGQAIHAAIRKYGWDAFVVEELYSNVDKQQTLVLEDHFIDLYETKGLKGYNITRGGQQGPPKGYTRTHMTEEQLESLRMRMKDPEIRQKISDGLRGNKNKIGWVAPLETRQKQSSSLKGRPGRSFSAEERKHRSDFMMNNQFALGAIPSIEKRTRHSEYMQTRDHSYKIGVPHTEEHKKKISESMKRTLALRRGQCLS